MRLRLRRRPVETWPPVTDEERAANEGLTLTDIGVQNLFEHVSGSHGRRCRGDCVQVVFARWAEAGWE